ncbi:MAG: hypothetical protein L0H41_11330 [Microlunatus sp.]|nr:hypothetical protein [Microlunatus sp.]MDN5770797.1 hypothetical protein [Microlunatus sp.]MDN5805042.1 hypothetical protein [Microlunatus sp.]
MRGAGSAGRRWRVLAAVGIAALLLLSLGLPHVGIAGAGLGRSLIPAGMLFSQVQPDSLGVALNLPRLSLGVSVTYLGVGLHQLGLVMALASFWVLAVEDINRWIYRVAVIAGWLLAASAPAVVIGWLLLRDSGAPALLGWAWLAALLAGVAIIVLARRSRDRIDRSWYVARPELQ